MTKTVWWDSNRILTIPGPGESEETPPDKPECHDNKLIMQVAGGYFIGPSVTLLGTLQATVQLRSTFTLQVQYNKFY